MSTISVIFLIQFFGFFLAYILFLRRTILPNFLVISTLFIYMSSPLLVLRSSITSAIYLSDFLLPLIIINFLNEKIKINKADRKIIKIVVVLLIIIPVISIIFGFTFGNSKNSDENYILGTVLWLYRAITYALLFIYGIRLKLSASELSSYFRMHLVLISVLIIFGIMNYVGGIDLAAFEQLSTVERDLTYENSENSSYGFGYLGLFRATVGVWMAVGIVILFGLIEKFRNKFDFIWITALISLSIIILLLSFSRAAVLGVVVGLTVLIIQKRGKFSHTILIFLLCAGAWATSVAVPEVYERLISLQDASDDASVTRLAGWELGVAAMASSSPLLLFGLGPASEGSLFEIIGMYGAHNELIDVWLKLGTGGLVAELFLIYALISRARKWHATKHLKTTYASDIFIAIIAVNVVASFTQTSHLLQTYASHPWGVYIYLLYGVLLGAAGPPSKEATLSVAAVPVRKNLRTKGKI